jgi:hypothetical protein
MTSLVLTIQERLIVENVETRKKLHIYKTEAEVMKAFFSMGGVGGGPGPVPKGLL